MICPSDNSGTTMLFARDAMADTPSFGKGQMVRGRNSPAFTPSARADTTAVLADRPEMP